MLNLSKSQKTLILGLSLSLMMLVVAIFSKDGFVTVHEFESELQSLVQLNQNIAEENEKLRKEIEGLKTDGYQIESLAREKLNLVKPGEVVYQIVPEESQPE
ncbi:MAG: septum formation initiator family protein [Candidatus Nitronauta litoralis]|uniref:Septum formation initiator family protein n=1 Tax=Candidatus Nitronauta litoralis TaxID=2705533 RepID=A0A7T0G1S7_9BACT|nr:MAG: septum formation initiator family protein [Candidatus Nitronauta litoralis]